jgi:predicted TIM-barrel fold metal-dependent hydrolase
VNRGDGDGEAPICLAPLPLSRRLDPPLPDNTCDCHFHVFAAGAPLAVPRSYTPQPLTLDDWTNLAAALNVARGVLVQPSVYGRDNAVLLAALAAAPERLRGIVVVEPDIPHDELTRLDRAGVRGIRINTRNLGGLSLADAEGLSRRIAPLGWHLQFQVPPQDHERLLAIVPRLAVPVVVDHFGLVPVDDEPAARSGAESLLRLLATGRCFIKLSAAYRLAASAEAAARLAQLAERLVAARPDRMLWGSDWPHTELWDAMPDDADLVHQALSWLGAPTTRQQVLIANPTRLYWYD